MKLYAIADLHLDGGANKPMDVFGNHWENHRERLFGAWQSVVGDGDCVLIPGDICWSMHFEAALTELCSIASLNGTKLMLRGNHDYWWTSISRMRQSVPACIRLLQNDSVDMDGFIVVGSRGWILPADSDFTNADRKIYDRELVRLELSLKSAVKAIDEKGKPLICMTHFPPLAKDGADTAFTHIMESYGVSLCVYGHLHGRACDNAFSGVKSGIEYRLCSADCVDFTPLLIGEF